MLAFSIYDWRPARTRVDWRIVPGPKSRFRDHSTPGTPGAWRPTGSKTSRCRSFRVGSPGPALLRCPGRVRASGRGPQHPARSIACPGCAASSHPLPASGALGAAEWPAYELFPRKNDGESGRAPTNPGARVAELPGPCRSRWRGPRCLIDSGNADLCGQSAIALTPARSAMTPPTSQEPSPGGSGRHSALSAVNPVVPRRLETLWSCYGAQGPLRQGSAAAALRRCARQSNQHFSFNFDTQTKSRSTAYGNCSPLGGRLAKPDE